jgi:zinc transport system substrate-binding protein
MKHTIIYICIATLLSAGLQSCNNANRKPNSDKEKIFVSIAPLQQLVKGITEDDFDIEVLVPAGASPESFEPTPRQFIALNRAKAVFAVGLIDFERNLLSKIEEQSKVIDLSQGIELIAGSCSHNHHGHH